MFKRIINPPRVNPPARESLRLILLLIAPLCVQFALGPRAEAAGRRPFLALSVWQQSPPAQDTQEAPTLALGTLIERELSGGGKHVYQITLGEGQYASVIVEQRGIDVLVRALGPDGKLIAEFDSEPGDQQQEKADLVAEAAGSYRLSVETKQQDARVGGYAIRLAELRAATEDDRSLQEARKLYAESLRLRGAGKFVEALPPGERALEIRRKVLGPEHPDVASSLNTLGVIYSRRGDFEKAEQLLKSALEIWEKALGPEHPNVAIALFNLANVRRTRGDFDEAEQLHQRALRIRETTLGPEHPDLASSLNDLAIVHRNKIGRAHV